MPRKNDNAKDKPKTKRKTKPPISRSRMAARRGTHGQRGRR